MSERGSFGSKLGVVLATAGSAVGLGNVWRFPYMVGENGGAAFILIYFGCIVLLGIPGMLGEFVIGRHAQANAARAYDKLSGGKPWKLVGYMGILSATVILGFYAVVAGWCLQYLFASFAGQVNGDAEYVRQYFVSFSSDALKPVLWGIGFVLLTHFVIVRGVRKGIERISKVLMPLLLLLLVIIVVASCLLPGALEGVRFLFMPDFSKLSPSILVEALGQAFFSLSLGTACLCTYASYFSRQTNLLSSALQIALLDTFIAILAGLMIFPVSASVGVSPDSGPSLIFITLPNVFSQAFATVPVLGWVISVMFYALLVFAALTSTISMHEIGTVFFSEEFHLPRRRAAWIITLTCSVICVFCALSVGAYPDLQVLGLQVMDFCDKLTANVMMPVGGLLTCLFVGWCISRRTVYDEFTNGGTTNTGMFAVWLFAVRYACPTCIILILLHQLGIL